MKTEKIAILSSFTIDLIQEQIKNIFEENKIGVEIFITPYNQYTQCILDTKSEFYNFKPSYIFVFLAFEDIFSEVFYTPYNMLCSDFSKYFDSKANEIISLFDFLCKNRNAEIFISICHFFYFRE